MDNSLGRKVGFLSGLGRRGVFHAAAVHSAGAWVVVEASATVLPAEAEQVFPEEVAAPTCQTCHMPGGDHEQRTAWGFLAVRLPLPEDEDWAADRVTILSDRASRWRRDSDSPSS